MSNVRTKLQDVYNSSPKTSVKSLGYRQAFIWLENGSANVGTLWDSPGGNQVAFVDGSGIEHIVNDLQVVVLTQQMYNQIWR